MFRDGASNGIVMLLSTGVAEATMSDFDDIAAMLAGAPVEVVDGSYARKTGLTGTVTVDDSNDRTDVDIPDQTWTALAGPDPVSLVVAYENAAADATRICLAHHDFALTSDGSDVIAQFNAAGFARAA
ncbi:MAG: hypothetical protein V3T08_09575 [Gemmatimonadota bacterium]